MPLAVHGAPIDPDAIVGARDVCERTRALGAIQRQRGSRHSAHLSAMKCRGCRLGQWQLVESLDRELGRTAVASTDGDPFINRRDPHIGRVTQGAPDNGRHRRRIAGAHSLDAQERTTSLSGLALGVLQARRQLPGIAEATGDGGGARVRHAANIRRNCWRPQQLSQAPARHRCRLHPSNVYPEMNSEGEGNRVYLPHGISSHKRAVLPSLPRYNTAEHATQPIGLLPHL